MTYVAAAGGTAGHVNPMLATATELAARGHEVIALGTSTGLEKDLVPSAGLELVTIDKVPFPRRPSMGALRFPGKLMGAITDVEKLLKDTGAAGLIGFGGYVSAPAYIAAKRAGVPVIIHEQNARPGMANKLGARWAAGVGLTFNDTPLQAEKGITRVTGLPLRPAISTLAADKADAGSARERRVAAASRFGLDPDRPIIVVTGGSSGATSLNEAIAQSGITELAQVLHITGKNKLGDIGDAAGANYRALEYVEDMEEAYAVADLVVSRSGAGMVAELAALGLPAVVVPLAIGNGEQYLNAKSYIDSGAFEHVEQSAVSPQSLTRAVGRVLDTLEERRTILSSSDISTGAHNLADLIEEVS